MNLIEKFGGYEKAKRELQLKEQNSVLQCCIAVTAEMIRDALLEYRRKHNIFEVGDLVVYKHPIGVERVVSVIDEHLIPRFLWQIRHATPEEIKANRRLRVLESDDCSDIRNHISPNTVVIDHAT